MAQKQFKIGLSNTDKQNMAQDVYERLLALTFPEYEATESYEVGDFVVYNDQLYKCIGATSGAWDSSKWQLATLNDLVTDIENAVAFVNDKANVNGNYPTMTVGFADNLTPYDESAGDDQDEPFSLQATGTGNGTQPDFSTGSGALMKEKQGNTVVVNQWAKELNATNYAGSGASASFSNGIATFTAIQQYGKLSSQTDAFNMINGHKYLAVIEHKGTIGSFNVYFSSGQYISGLITDSASAFTLVAKVFEYSQASGNTTLHFQDNRTSDWTEQQIKNLIIIDLTQWFNGDIPQDLLDHPSNFFRYYQGSLAYNEGTLVNANGRYIKCIGMNQWDEEWEQGGYNATTGEKYSLSGAIRSKNYIKVIPNTDYYFKISGSAYCRICFYDKDKNFISCLNWDVANFNKVNKTPSNACYLTFNTNDNYGTTYNNDISINLYYEDEPRCLTYEPYQVLTNNDTGTEVLRKAGNVCDIKLPDGTITRRIGVVDLGTLDWAYNTSYTYPHFKTSVSGLKYNVTVGTTNIICSKYTASSARNYNSFRENNLDKQICVIINQGGSPSICVQDTAYTDAVTFKASLSGVYLFYELAEPTNEQGTPFSENLVIDDFGSMDFQGTSGVPQGALIFYPVDYKAFVDTLYKYTDGTPSNIALKSDLSTEQSARESVDTQLKNAVGGTLRQCLCVKESLDFDNTAFVDLGTLNWLYSTLDDTPAFTSGVALADLGANKKSICSKYSSQDGYQTTNKTYSLMRGENGTIWVIDNSYTDATAFKNAMKGVLLAYEKASE